MASELKIGWARRDISTTEPVCIHGQFYLRISQGVLDPITVTALALSNDDDAMLLLSCDATSVPEARVEVIRQRVMQLRPEIAVEKIVVNATHTHSTGDISGGMSRPGVDFPVDRSIRIMPTEEYQEFFYRQAVDALVSAWDSRCPGGVSWGYGYAVTSMSRRTWYLEDMSKEPGFAARAGMMVNGRARMYGDPNHPKFSHFEAGADHFANFLYTFDPAGKLTGAVVNVACPSQCSMHSTALSADYWHEVRKNLQARFGDIHVLPQCAPAGDLETKILHYQKAHERRLRLKGIDRRQEIADVIADAFAEVLDWAAKDIRTTVRLRHDVLPLELPRRQITAEEYADEKVQYAALMAESFVETGAPMERLRQNSTLGARRARSRRFIETYEHMAESPNLGVEIHLMAVDDIAIVTSPFELYIDFMHRIQARSPFVQTFNVQLASLARGGRGGYLATERGVEGGGYSASRYCNAVSPQGGQRLVDATVDGLHAIHAALWGDDQTTAAPRP